jgi:hypothetical protein
MSQGLTTIRISRELRDDLADLGSKRETYETIIRRLLKTMGAAKK